MTMTREEAIKILKAIRVYECYPKSASEETKEAIDMAIESLSEPNRKPDYSYEAEMVKRLKAYKQSGDLISRADVFEIIDKAFSQPMGNVVTLYADICLMLNVLPTHANSRSTHERDLINRADAIEAVNMLDIFPPTKDAVARELMAIPSAEADRPSGEWTYLHGSIGSYMTISCPFCGKTFNDVAEWEYNYCPSCGARMKGGDTE